MSVVHLAPTVDDDGWSGPVTYLWEQIGGPDTAPISDPEEQETDVTLPDGVQGTYTFRLTATNDSFSGAGYVRIFAYSDAPAPGERECCLRVTIDGVEYAYGRESEDADKGVREGTISITENEPGKPNTAVFDVKGFVPEVGQSIRIALVFPYLEDGETPTPPDPPRQWTQDFTVTGGATSGLEYFVADYEASDDINDIYGWPNVLLFDGVPVGPISWGAHDLFGWHWDYRNHRLVHNLSSPHQDGPVPDGTVITVTYATKQNDPRLSREFTLFAGIIMRDTHEHIERPENGEDNVSAVDHTWQATRRLVTQRWINKSATDIAKDIIGYVPDFTTQHVQSGLPYIEDFSVTNLTASEALSQVAELIGGYWEVDYDKDVHFGVFDPSQDDPLPLDSRHLSFNDFGVSYDLTQTVNRVIAVGNGANVRLKANQGASTLWITRVEQEVPDVDDVPQSPIPIFNPAGGEAIVDGVGRITYTGFRQDYIDQVYGTTQINVEIKASPGSYSSYYHADDGTTDQPQGTGQLGLKGYAYAFTLQTALGETPTIASWSAIYLQDNVTIDDEGTLARQSAIRLRLLTLNGTHAERVARVNVYRTTSPDVTDVFPPLSVGTETNWRLVGSLDPIAGSEFFDTVANRDVTSDKTYPYVNTADEIGYYLTGVTGLTGPAAEGTAVNVCAVVDDFDSQAELAAIFGGDDDGVIETTLSDSSKGDADLQDWAQAWLGVHAIIAVSVGWRSRDLNTRRGRFISINLPEPDDVHDDFRIKTVTISAIYDSTSTRLASYPTFTARAEPKRTTLEDILLRKGGAFGGGGGGGGGTSGGSGVVGAGGGVGPQGPAGPAGAAGPAGPAGPTGPTGPAGADGPAGPQGDPGPEGPAGPTTIVVGTTTTGAPGTDADVVNSGTDDDLILDFTIPRGEPGETGPAGPAGADGATGATGATGPQGETGPAGPTGATGPQGPQGEPGEGGGGNTPDPEAAGDVLVAVATALDAQKFWVDGEAWALVPTAKDPGAAQFWREGAAFGGLATSGAVSWQRLARGAAGDVLTTGVAGVGWSAGIGGSSSAGMGAAAYRNATFSLADVTPTVVTFTTEAFDNGGFWSPSAPTRMTVPTGADGIYAVTGSAAWDSGFVGAAFIILYVNGVERVRELSNAGSNVAAPYYGNAVVTAQLALSVGDYVELVLEHRANAPGGGAIIREGLARTFLEIGRLASERVITNELPGDFAEGDLIVGVSDSWGRKAVGANGEALVVASGLPVWRQPSAVVASTATGNQHNWAPGLAGETTIFWSGASDLTITGFAGGALGQRVRLVNTGSAVAYFAHQSGSSSAGNKLRNTATSGNTPVAAGGSALYQYDGTDWRLVEHEQGAWITPTYAAGDFTANGSMTWTVEAADVTTYAYRLAGRTLYVQANLGTTTVGGTVSDRLQMATPGGFTTLKNSRSICQVVDNGVLRTGATMVTLPSTAIIFFAQPTVGNWTLSTNNTTCIGSIFFEVN